MLAGVVLTVVSAVLYNSGFVAEKVAVGRMPEIHAARSFHMVRTLASSPLWLAGFTSLLAGLCCQVVALSLAPIAVVQPVFASGIALLVVLSTVVLGERLRRSEWAGLAAVAVALVLVGLSLGSGSDRVGLAGSLDKVAAFAVPTVVAAVMAFVAATRLPRGGAALYGVSAGLLYGVATLGLKGVSTIIDTHGLLPAVPAVLASPDPYVVVMFSVLGLLAFQTGLQRCRVSVVAPVSNVVSSAYLVAVGTVIFGERLPSDPARLALRLAGFAGILVGMVVLARGGGMEGLGGSAPVEPVDLGLATAAEPVIEQMATEPG